MYNVISNGWHIIKSGMNTYDDLRLKIMHHLYDSSSKGYSDILIELKETKINILNLS